MKCSMCDFPNPDTSKFCESCGAQLSRICPKCNHENSPEVKFCSECGSQLDKVCSECGATNPLHARFCNSCGKALGTAVATSAAQKAAQEQSSPPRRATSVSVEASDRSREEANLSRFGYAMELQKFIPPALRDMYLGAGGRIEGERKIVNMIFSDVSGFATLSEKYVDEPEEIQRMINECLRRQARQIYALEGYVDKFVGDELVALFGTPIWHEDDAQRAVMAALRMRDAVERYSNELGRESGVQLHVHIGINTGRVAVGGIGDDMFMNYTVIGDPVNMASRIEDIAEAGQIIVGELTHKLTEALFDYREPRYVELEGKDKPQPIYELIGPKEHPESARGLAGFTSRMVGREAEWENLKTYMGEASAGTAQMVSIVAEAGLGKSRLKQELKAEYGDSVVWVEGQCLELTQRTAYSVFLDAIKSYFGLGRMDEERHLMVGEALLERNMISQSQLETALSTYQLEKDDGRRLGELLVDLGYVDRQSVLSCYALQSETPYIKVKIEAGICQLFEGVDNVSPTEDILPYLFQLMSLELDAEMKEKIKYVLDNPEDLERHAFLAIKAILLQMAKKKRLVLVLEDLHWVDHVSLDLIAFLMESPDFEGLIICIHRQEEQSICQRIPVLAQERFCERFCEITLNRLSDDNMKSILDSLLPLEESDSSQALKELMLRRAEGNPLYLEEIIRTLLESKAIERAVGEARYIITQAIEDIDVPVGVESIVRARIDSLTRLKDGSKETLLRASVIGRIFDRQVLESISPEYVDLDRHLDRLLRMGLITPSSSIWPGQEYSFRHILTHRIAYDSVIGRRRRELHGQIGNCMEELYPEDLYPDKLGFVVDHYRRSDSHDKAVTYLIKAGHRARYLYNNDAAIECYSDALGRIGKLTEIGSKDDMQNQIYESLGDVYRVTSRFDEALKSYEEAMRLCSIPESRASIYRRMGDIHEKKGDYDIAKEQYESGVAELRAHADSVEFPRLYNGLGYLHYRRGEYSETIRMCKQALEILGHINDYVTLAETYKNLAIARFLTGNAEEAFVDMDLSVEVAEKTNNQMLLARLYNTKAAIQQMSNSIDDTIETLQRVLEMRTELGDTDGLATTKNSLGMAYTTKGEYVKAIDCLEDSLRLAQRVGNIRLAADSYNNQGVVYWYMKEFDRAIECYQKCQGIYRDINFPRAIALYAGNIAEAYREKGDLEEAEKHHLESIEIARQIGDREVECRQYCGLGRIHLARGNNMEALENLEHALALAEELNDHEAMGDACKGICEACWRISKWEEGRDYFDQAINHYAEIGAEAKLRELQDLKARL